MSSTGIEVNLLDDVLYVNELVGVDEFSVTLSENDQGPPGSTNLRVHEVTSQTHTVIDYALGNWQRLTLVGDIDTFEVIHWPDASVAARMVLEITNTGAFAINAWPGGTLWPSGDAPIITHGAGSVDLIILSTGSGGAPIFGSLVGQNYI